MLCLTGMASAQETKRQCTVADDGKAGLCGHARAQLDLLATSATRSAAMRAIDDQTDVTHCLLDIELNPGSYALSGSNTMQVTSQVDGLTSFVVDLFDEMTVTAVTVNGIPAAYTHADDRIEITLNSAYNTGATFTVEVSYAGAPYHLSPSAGYSGTHGSPPTVVMATHSQPFNAPAWWPCKGAIDDKFTMDMWVTAPDWMTVASNGTLEGVDVLTGDRLRHRWHEDYPISVYLVSIAATNYSHWTEYYVHDAGAMPVDLFIYPEDVSWVQPLVADLVTMIETFSHPGCFGEYPFITEKYGIAQFEGCCGMEHQTITSQGSFPERRTVHELAHMWWGDALTCRTWHDIWLNEGFARYAESLWHERKPGGSHAAYLSHMMTYRPSSYGGTVYRYDISTSSEIFSVTNVYNKASWVMHMLRHVLGDDVFYEVLATYRGLYEGGSADTEQFRAVVENVTGRDLEWFFEQWVYGAGAPYYRFGWMNHQQGEQQRVLLHLEQYQTTWPAFRMPLDVTLSFAGGGEETRVLWLDRRDQWYILDVPESVVDLEVDRDTWILRGAVNEVAYTAGCNEPAADLTGDARVDLADFALLQTCFTGADAPGGFDATLCGCLDRDEDNDIDGDDLEPFEACLAGPAASPGDCLAGPVLFADDFDVDTSANWNIAVSSSDTSITFAYDYSTDGIPPAPNSANATTRGVKFTANMTSPGELDAVTISPVGMSFDGDYTLKFDMWINANGPFPLGGTGSTEFVTAGVGSTGHTVNNGGVSGSGAWFAVDGEGGSSRDYRAYKDATEQTIASGQYLVASNDHSDATLTGHYRPRPAPPAQQAGYPQQTGYTRSGSGGFAWHEVEIAVDAAAGTATWRIDGLAIAAIDRNTGADVSLAGAITLGYMDGFTSISDNPQLSFGLIDNVRVVSELP